MKTEDLGPFVEKFARQLAAYPPHTIAHIKAAVNQGVLHSVPGSLLSEAHQADLCVANPVTQARVKEGLGLGIETHDGELDLPARIAELEPAP